MSRRGLACAVAALALSTVPVAVLSPSAVSQEVSPEQQQEGAPQAEDPEDLPGLIERMADVAQRVSAKGEEVKGLEDELAESEKEIGELELKAEEAQRTSEDASAAVAEQQERIDALAQKRYRRNAAATSVSAALNANDVASAVERMGYLGALSKAAKREEDAMVAASAAADNAHQEAVDAAEEARHKRDELQVKRDSVLKEKAELEEQQKELEATVDGLSPEAREAWVQHFGGSSDLDLAALADGSGSAAVEAALSRIGAPYGWGATGPDVFDCSGLMVWSYQQMGKSIPRTSQAQLAGGTPVPLDQLQPGDIVGYYPGVTHVGMYIGDGQIVHASTYGVPVAVVPLNSMPVEGAVRY
ncbi:hydrolase [Corynebacterium sp. HMSC056E09]|uniref:NlpC/P60 family protein n=1 Tax=Corynebacterium hesseae TaxID=2913502 RepID=A0ABU9UGN7_9CORY|nr:MULTISPECIES: C40 family peptidase [Corynebacterium]MCG7261649.1 NlpC/P60 family protein [Corynebacterium aurimucosum]OFQ91320.1 hydrolase [Corynebacterium sp. HMSC056E09]PKZ25981.1 hydrolase [Corynebacterium aurimucosum]TRX33820.1 hydrolase [Corynebacterium guaraldiae]